MFSCAAAVGYSADSIDSLGQDSKEGILNFESQLQSSAFFRGRPTSTQLQWPGRPNKDGVAGQDTLNDRYDDTHDLNTFCRKQSTAN